MQPYYHGRPRNTRHKRRIPAIPGGSHSIPATALIIVWAAYRQRKLNWLAVRVWLALWEIQCWHKARQNSNDSPHYHTSQIASAIKSPAVTPKRLTTAVSALQKLNLVAFTSTTLWIAASLDDLQDPELRVLAEGMISHVGQANLARGLRIPRRMLSFLMRSKRPMPVYAGVMIALLIRTMMTKRYGTYKGCCTASWIALVFGGDPSSIKSARARLIADGWFSRLETPQRVRQRYGEWVVLVIEHPVDNVDETEPPTPAKPAVIEPPLRNQSLSCEIATNQSLQPGASQPRWENIRPIDLHTPQRRQQLYQAALSCGVIHSTEADRLTFFAAIAHASRVARKNACGLLRRLVETPTYHPFISQDDEEKATSWLRSKQPECTPPTLFHHEPKADPHDQQIVSYLYNRFMKAGFPMGNCFALITATQEGRENIAGWTRERWDRAVAALKEKGPFTTLGRAVDHTPSDADTMAPYRHT